MQPAFSRIADRYKIPKRVPLSVFKDIVSEKDLVIVLLEPGAAAMMLLRLCINNVVC